MKRTQIQRIPDCRATSCSVLHKKITIGMHIKRIFMQTSRKAGPPKGAYSWWLFTVANECYTRKRPISRQNACAKFAITLHGLPQGLLRLCKFELLERKRSPWQNVQYPFRLTLTVKCDTVGQSGISYYCKVIFFSKSGSVFRLGGPQIIFCMPIEWLCELMWVAAVLNDIYEHLAPGLTQTEFHFFFFF